MEPQHPQKAITKIILPITIIKMGNNRNSLTFSNPWTCFKTNAPNVINAIPTS